MEPNAINALNTLRRRKKHLIAAGGALVALATLGVIGAGYAVYKSASYASDKVQDWKPNAGENINQLSMHTQGFVQGLVMNVASSWIQQGLASNEATQVKSGLTCFDAIGGPNPSELVDYVKRTVVDVELRKKLDALTQNLTKDASKGTGSAACANWLLNS